VEGYSLEDTAQIMGKTRGAIKALQHRALQSLARKLTT
jgi:DNA-directed RNA polymerase specialized sigma24 family protein